MIQEWYDKGRDASTTKDEKDYHIPSIVQLAVHIQQKSARGGMNQLKMHPRTQWVNRVTDSQ
jgi:hypothetical protein